VVCSRRQGIDGLLLARGGENVLLTTFAAA